MSGCHPENESKLKCDRCGNIYSDYEVRNNKCRCISCNWLFPYKSMKPDIYSLIERVERLESEIQKREIISKSNPHKCPACDGFGRRLYNIIESATCKPCEGQGILWK